MKIAVIMIFFLIIVCMISCGRKKDIPSDSDKSTPPTKMKPLPVRKHINPSPKIKDVNNISPAPTLSVSSTPLADASSSVSPEPWGMEGVILAIMDGKIDRVDEIITENPDIVKERDQYDNTLMHYAAVKGDVRIVKLLISYEAELNGKNKWGFTPLHELARREENNEVVEIVELLIFHNAKLNVINDFKNTPLDIAEVTDKTEVASMLRKYGGKRNNHAVNLPPLPELIDKKTPFKVED